MAIQKSWSRMLGSSCWMAQRLSSPKWMMNMTLESESRCNRNSPFSWSVQETVDHAMPSACFPLCDGLDAGCMLDPGLHSNILPTLMMGASRLLLKFASEFLRFFFSLESTGVWALIILF